MARQRCRLEWHLMEAGAAATALQCRVQVVPQTGELTPQTGASDAHSELCAQASPRGSGGIVSAASPYGPPSPSWTQTKQAPARLAVIVAEVPSGSTATAMSPLSQ